MSHHILLDRARLRTYCARGCRYQWSVQFADGMQWRRFACTQSGRRCRCRALATSFAWHHAQVRPTTIPGAPPSRPRCDFGVLGYLLNTNSFGLILYLIRIPKIVIIFFFLLWFSFQGTTAASHGKIEFGRAQIDFALLPAADILQNILLNLVVYLFLVI